MDVKTRGSIIEEFPIEDEIFQWIEGLCKFPHRRTGSAESRKAAEYIKEEFEKIGLKNVTIESTPSVIFEANDYFLRVADKDVSCFMINGTLHPHEKGSFNAGDVCLDTELIYIGEGRADDFANVDVRGKIVMCDCPWLDSDEETYSKKWCASEGIVYDPDQYKRSILRKKDSYSPNTWPYNYFLAQKRNAAGFVGVLRDYFNDGIYWNEDYSELASSQGCKSMAIPGLWIGMDAFSEISKVLKDGRAKASLGLKTKYEDGFASNVWGVLPGITEEIVLVHSHYDAVFKGAVQDASGMSVVLALAKYFSQVPIEKRKKTFCFAGFDGHYTDYAGHKFFLDTRKAEGKKIIYDFVVEHIGKEVGLGDYNHPVISEEPEIRLLYVTDINDAVDIAVSTIIRNDIKRTIILPVKPSAEKQTDNYVFCQDEVISDAYYSHINGIPVISLLSPQMYLFHPMDTQEMIPKGQVVPIGTAIAEMIHHICEK